MADSDTYFETLTQNAAGPKQASVDGVNALQHSLDEQIKFHQYLRTIEAQQNGACGVKISRIVPPGAV